MKLMMIAVGCLIILYILYVVVYLFWWSRNYFGLSYYGKPLAERRKIKYRIFRYGKGFNFFLKILSLILGDYLYNRKWEIKPVDYKPRSDDIFIVTYPRSGTTWTQQIVYEILSRGNGDLSDRGHVSLNAVSPWMESLFGVSMEQAPLIGAKKNRIIKTHLPSDLCPYSEKAKYIYIARHPVNCCASNYDWFVELTGPLMCSLDKFIDYLCSDLYPFKPWPTHMDEYWQLSQNRNNVLFLHFEEMKQDLPAVIKKTATFLEYDVTDEEIIKIAEKSSFKYMSEHWELFEMSPPLPYMSKQPFFKSGSLKRKTPFSDDQKEKIYNYCKEQLKESSYPFEKYYPEL